MRLRLSVQRNTLPPTDVLWTVSDDQVSQKAFTIARLLDDVNRIVPLESDTWGLEDYVVTVGGYECLHFAQVGHVLKDEDRVSVRSLQTPEVRARTLAGRCQISEGGQHLVDGIPFGRPHLRDPNRPPVRIPPRKRRRITEEVEVAVYGELVDNEEAQPNGMIPQHWKLALNAPEDNEDDEDGNYTSGLAAGKPKSTVPAKRQKSVRFDSLPISQELVTLPFEDEDDSEDYNPDQDMDTSETSEEDSDNSDSSASESDSDDSSSASSSSSSDSESSSSDDEESNNSLPDELPSKLPPNKLFKDDITSTADESVKAQQNTPPGTGKAQTRERNKRRRESKKTYLLKHYGLLAQDATRDDFKKLRETMTEEELNEKALSAKLANPTLAAMPVHTSIYDKDKKLQAQSNINSTKPNDRDKKTIELRARNLLNAIENGGIDVTPEHPAKRRNSKKGTLPKPTGDDSGDLHAISSHDKAFTSIGDSASKETSSGQQTATENETPEQPAAKRARLDLAGSRRLLFGSLGVRTPKSKEDEEKLRIRLAAKAKSPGKAKTTVEPEKDEELSDLEDSDAWKEKINLTAFECWYEDVELSTPPFPFVQRWDPQQKLKNDRKASKGKKRKRANAQYYDVGEKMYGEFRQEGDQGEGSSNVQLNYDDEEDQNIAGEGDDEAIALETQLQQDMEGAASRDDLPTPPADLSTLADLTYEDVKKGTIIVFKELVVSLETGWKPTILPHRTAIVVDIEPDQRRIFLALAQRDQSKRTINYDANGNRIYEQFEMAHSDSEGDSEEDGWLSLTFEELLEAKLLQQPSGEANDSEAGLNEEKASDDVNIEDTHIPPTSSPEPHLSLGQH
ncbi:uncharacterized protein BDZ99DRAFT_464100, partial [Mytilinidion resinicola]